MNTRIIGIIISREYLTRVKKKSFLLITFLAPILFAALCIVPSLIMFLSSDESKVVAVVDNSAIVMPVLESGKTVSYIDCTGQNPDSLKKNMAALSYDAVLQISAINPETRNVTAEIVSSKPLGIDVSENIENKIETAVQDYRIASYNIEGLKDIMEEVKANISLKSYTLDDSGEEKISSSGVNMAVSMILGMVIYMFIIIFGSMVMSSVIEEKSSRVVEVLVSSVKATELMFGKIIGIALVALTQFFLWIALTLAIMGVFGVIAGNSLLGNMDPAQMVEMTSVPGMGADAAQLESLTQSLTEGDSEMAVILTALRNLPIVKILVCFLFYFIFGYMLYASLFAAIGSAVENEGDSNQLQLPVTIPILIAFFIAIYAFRAPDSSLAVWGSMIPFTSPIVMLARLPFDVPMWQIVLSIALLVLTFAACAWLSAKIYRIGILMFGKKSTFKDLWKWLKQK